MRILVLLLIYFFSFTAHAATSPNASIDENTSSESLFSVPSDIDQIIEATTEASQQLAYHRRRPRPPWVTCRPYNYSVPECSGYIYLDYGDPCSCTYPDAFGRPWTFPGYVIRVIY